MCSFGVCSVFGSRQGKSEPFVYLYECMQHASLSNVCHHNVEGAVGGQLDGVEGSSMLQLERAVLTSAFALGQPLLASLSCQGPCICVTGVSDLRDVNQGIK